MSNIDTDLANKVIIMEHLNHLPPQEPLYQVSHLPRYNETYPLPPTDERLKYKYSIPTDWLRLLRSRFQAHAAHYPINANNIILWQKYHVRYKCFVGSESSQRCTVMNCGDDSYIWWQAGGVRQYGRVIIFAIVYDWEPIAVVRRYRQVEEDREIGITVVVQSEGRMETITVQQIGGLIGRIEKHQEGKKTVRHNGCSR